MDLMHGFKGSQVGPIPTDWEVRPLLSTVSIASGQVNPKIEPYKSIFSGFSITLNVDQGDCSKRKQREIN